MTLNADGDDILQMGDCAGRQFGSLDITMGVVIFVAGAIQFHEYDPIRFA
jgi:hypothetical protein